MKKTALGAAALLALLAAATSASAGRRHPITAAAVGSAPAARGPATRFAGGIFHASCQYTHSLSDDPLRLPGQPGASHEHAFIGNSSTNAFSRGGSLLANNQPLGAGTACSRRGDGSAYWVPALYDHVSPGVYIRYLPDHMDTYYAGDFDPTLYQATPFPPGFGQILGENGNGVAQWGCALHGTLDSAPSQCASGTLVLAIRGSNNCWDGQHLFLQDQSHLANLSAAQCVARHWKILPALRGFVVYKVGTSVHNWTLAYDPMVGGYMTTAMAHLDFMSGWDPATIANLVQTCLNTPANRPSPQTPCKGASN